MTVDQVNGFIEEAQEQIVSAIYALKKARKIAADLDLNDLEAKIDDELYRLNTIDDHLGDIRTGRNQ